MSQWPLLYEPYYHLQLELFHSHPGERGGARQQLSFISLSNYHLKIPSQAPKRKGNVTLPLSYTLKLIAKLTFIHPLFNRPGVAGAVL